MKAALETRRITREALDRYWVKLELEQSQQRVRYEQGRDLELEREEMAIRDAEGKVKGLENDYRTYKTERRPPKRGCEDTRRPGQPTHVSLPAVAAPASPVLPVDSKDEPPNMAPMVSKCGGSSFESPGRAEDAGAALGRPLPRD